MYCMYINMYMKYMCEKEKSQALLFVIYVLHATHEI